MSGATVTLPQQEDVAEMLFVFALKDRTAYGQQEIERQELRQEEPGWRCIFWNTSVETRKDGRSP